MRVKTGEVKKDTNLIPFVKEVARYFMDFLETDFHKERIPKRHFQQKDGKLQVSVELGKYHKYNTLVWKVIRSGFKDEAINELKPGVFKNQEHEQMLQLIQKQIDLISQGDIDKVIKKFQNERSAPKNIIDATNFILDGRTRVIKEDFLATFIRKISEPLEKIKTASADSASQIEEKLTEIFKNSFKMALTNKSPEQEFNIDENLALKSDIQNKLSSFFKDYLIADIFYEILELVRNKDLLDKKEFYLNFCDITYEDKRYPLFYIPVQITKAKGKYQLSFNSLLYVNKKAIKYISEKREIRASPSFLKERIIYIAENSSFIDKIGCTLSEAITYFSISQCIDTKNPRIQVAKSNEVQISNRCYFSLFDKSDESIINDYEEILQKLDADDDILAQAFEVLINNFIRENPASVVKKVGRDWEDHSSLDKLIYSSSPIPLNEEQRQILIALNQSECKYVIVEGPPGTGKSHTITAIICDAILKNKSTLVLSDKKEALDVVEDKITATMNKARLAEKFQNTILRLGKIGNTCSKIFSNTSMENIKDHHKVIKNKYKSLEVEIQDTVKGLKSKVSSTIESYKSIRIHIPDIDELNILKEEFSSEENLPFNLEELYKDKQSDKKLQEIKKDMLFLKQKLPDSLKNLFCNLYPDPDSQTIDSFQNFLTLIKIVEETKGKKQESLLILNHVQNLSKDGLETLGNFIDQCKQIGSSKIWIRLSKGKQIRELCAKLQKDVKHDFEKPHLRIKQFEAITGIFCYAEEVKTNFEFSGNFQFQQDFVKWVHLLLKTDTVLPDKKERNRINSIIKAIQDFAKKFPATIQVANLDIESIFSLFDNAITKYPKDKFDNLVKYISLENTLSKKLRSVPQYSYTDEKAKVEDLITDQMTYKMYEKVIDFYHNKRNDAMSFNKMISKKQRFDKKGFEDLKNVFPCILAGIRDFAEYIPLEFGILDIVIIDEASQVSIAQAFPALLRAKKVIIFGDKQQFSNVKSSHASSDRNREYLNRLEKVFPEGSAMQLVRLAKFNIKTSILEFFENISNYHIMLKKHFRGYKELISYSSKYFYNDSLQAVKIRVKPIDKVIRFSHIKHDGKIEVNSNTNQLEIDAILAEVEELCKSNPTVSIGILTPFRDQRELLFCAFKKHSEYENYLDKNKLKIMTFDTCQGEERDVILYSMVANPAINKLGYIFIRDLKSVDLEEDKKLKAQRLNVGFSRAKECMHFFLSLPIDEYTGPIGDALKHYIRVRDLARQSPSVNDTDPRSPMEKKVWDWIQETAFFKENQKSIVLQAQFKIGEYIKQLDKYYEHPKFVADFLLAFTDDKNNQHKILIEYDGFEHHFKEHDSVNKTNYEKFYTEDHVYREKQLESYGHKFLRINRFNVGKDPIQTLSVRLEELVKSPK